MTTLSPPTTTKPGCGPLKEELAGFSAFGSATIMGDMALADGGKIPTYTNEFWTSKQRAGHSIHEVPYRACFKSQLPKFLIQRLSAPGDVVYDPFSGRGTTAIEAALLGRVPVACDISPLSEILAAPRLSPPTESAVRERLGQIDLCGAVESPPELLAFYHPETLKSITNLRRYLIARREDGELDDLDRWIRMVATSRLTGHSAGFFSVYTLPPNQAVSVARQLKINEGRNQTPPARDISAIILKKTRSLLKGCTAQDRKLLAGAGAGATFLTRSCDATPEIETGSVSLVVTSPPFLDVVDYRGDNWLRCWFNGIDPASVDTWQLRREADWQSRMTEVISELRRVLKPGGHVAFEVGEVKGGKLPLGQLVVPAGVAAGLRPELVMINDQEFTKTSNCWGVDNRKKGTITNRIVIFEKTA